MIESASVESDAPAIVIAAPKASARREALDKFFRELGQSKDEIAADEAAKAIAEKMRRHNGPVIELLLIRALSSVQRAEGAIEGLTTARRFLDEAVAIDPECAQCWADRAFVAQAMGEPGTAVKDFNAALTLEPRHFIAWFGLGNVMRSLNRDKEALDAYERALALHPFFEAARQNAAQLRLIVRGRPA